MLRGPASARSAGLCCLCVAATAKELSPPCPLRAARDGGRGAAGGCRSELLSKNQGLAENWRARLNRAAEGVQLERGANTEGR